MNNVVTISIDDKSAEELEAEIAAQLEAAGLDAEVSVIMEGDDHMKIEVRAEADGSMAEGGSPQIVLTSGGEPLAGMGAHGEFRDSACRIMIEERQDTGAKSMILELENNGHRVCAKVDNFQDLSDAELASQVQKMFLSQGINTSVSAQDGRVSVRVVDSADAEAGTEETTWGQLKSKEWKDN